MVMTSTPSLRRYMEWFLPRPKPPVAPSPSAMVKSMLCCFFSLGQQFLDAVDPGLADDLAEEEDADDAQVDAPMRGRG